MRFWFRQQHIRHWMLAVAVLVGTAVFVYAVWLTPSRQSVAVPIPPYASTAAASMVAQAPKPDRRLEQTSQAKQHPATSSNEVAYTTTSLLAAFDCARAKRGLSAVVRDTQLDAAAQALLSSVQQDQQGALIAAQNRYPFVAQLLLRQASSSSECSVGGINVEEFPQFESAQRVGIATQAVPGTDAYGGLLQAVVIGQAQP